MFVIGAICNGVLAGFKLHVFAIERPCDPHAVYSHLANCMLQLRLEADANDAVSEATVMTRLVLLNS